MPVTTAVRMAVLTPTVPVGQRVDRMIHRAEVYEAKWLLR
jgi:hypothetical protein